MRVIFLLFAVFSLCASVPEEYLKTFPDLRKQEKWDEIVDLGVKALSDSPTDKELIQIHGHLASSYFYLGDFEEVEHHANHCYKFACKSGDKNEQAHGLYLLSAAARSRGEFEQARIFARKGLPLAEGEMKAKVYFNLGAAEADDPDGNLEEAENAYKEARDLFECPEDQQRTSIRLGKIYLLKGDLDEAERVVEALLPLIQCDRISMHSEYLSAQIEKARGNPEEARNFAAHALEKAERLGAKKDIERLQNFLNAL